MLKGPHFLAAKNWQNSGYVATFLTKFAPFDEQEWHFGGKNLWSLPRLNDSWNPRRSVTSTHDMFDWNMTSVTFELEVISSGNDLQQNLMVVTHSQATCTRNLYKSTCTKKTWPSDMVSCTRFFLYKFLAPNTAQLYSVQETCMHVTRMVSSDWLADYRCHVFILLCWCCWQFVVQS